MARDVVDDVLLDEKLARRMHSDTSLSKIPKSKIKIKTPKIEKNNKINNEKKIPFEKEES